MFDNLRVRRVEDDLLEVLEEITLRRWTVSAPDVLGDRIITYFTFRTRVISTDGPVGRRILAAVAEFEAKAAS